MEDDQCYPPGTENCDKESTALPIASFEHTFTHSVIGGYVYREEDIPWLRGQYVYGDYFRGLFQLDPTEPGIQHFPQVLIYKPRIQHGEELGEVMFFSSLTEDAVGELYATSLSSAVYKLQHLSPQQIIEGIFQSSWRLPLTQPRVVIDAYADCKSVVLGNERVFLTDLAFGGWCALCQAIE